MLTHEDMIDLRMDAPAPLDDLVGDLDNEFDFSLYIPMLAVIIITVIIGLIVLNKRTSE